MEPSSPDAQTNEALDYRTRHITVVLEDVYQPHNAASIIRSCDNHGIQDLHVLEGRNAFSFDPEATFGAARRISLHRHHVDSPDDARAALQALKDAGYHLVATSLRPGCISLEELPLDHKVALCFGTELKGLSEVVHDMADIYLRIPMFGMTQSLNVSVSAAICLHRLRARLQATSVSWQLTSEERAALTAAWRP